MPNYNILYYEPYNGMLFETRNFKRDVYRTCTICWCIKHFKLLKNIAHFCLTSINFIIYEK